MKNRGKLDERKKEQICKLYSMGLSLRLVAYCFKVSYEAVRLVLKEKGIARRKTSAKNEHFKRL